MSVPLPIYLLSNFAVIALTATIFLLWFSSQRGDIQHDMEHRLQHVLLPQVKLQESQRARQEATRRLIEVCASVRGWAETMFTQIVEARLARWNAKVAKAFDTNRKALETRLSERYETALNADIRALLRTSGDRYRQQFVETLGTDGKAAFQAAFANRGADLVANLRATLENQPREMAMTTALPLGTRFSFRKGQCTIYVVEQQPSVRTIVHSQSKQGHGYRYRLAFPYVIFVYVLQEGTISDLHVYFRNSPLTSLNDTLYAAALPNIATSGSVCFPGYEDDHDGEADLVGKSIEVFWGSQFNNDHHRVWAEASPRSCFLDFSKWEQKSEADPSFVLDQNWKARGQLGAIIQDRLGNASRPNYERVIKNAVEQSAARAATDVMEAIVTKVKSWRPEDNVVQSLEEVYKTLGKQTMEDAIESLGKTGKDAIQRPSSTRAEAEVEQKLSELFRAIDARLEWFGITPDPSSQR